MDLRVEVRTTQELAPKRIGSAKNREDVLLPLTLRERVCVAALGLNLEIYEKLAERYREEPAFVEASVLLLRTFKDVTGVSWENARGFW